MSDDDYTWLRGKLEDLDAKVDKLVVDVAVIKARMAGQWQVKASMIGAVGAVVVAIIGIIT